MENARNIERGYESNEGQQRELVGQIFDRAQVIVKRHGEPSEWGKSFPKEVAYLDVSDKEDLRRKNRVLVWADPESEKVVVFYNKNYTRGVHLDTQIHLTKGGVTNFDARINVWHGDSMISNPPWRPPSEAVKIMGSRFHPAEYMHGDLNASLLEINRFLVEGKVIQKPKKDRLTETVIGKLKEVEQERVFGKPQEAVKKAKEIWSDEAIRQNLEELRNLPEEEQAEVEEKLALGYVDAAFKELSAINSLAQDTPDFDTKQKLLDEAREEIRRERKFHILAKRLAKTVSDKDVDWSKIKLNEFGRMYERHETPECWQLAKLIYQKLIQLSERDNDLAVQSAATIQLARVSEKLGEESKDVDRLYKKAHDLNWQSRGDKDYNRQITIEGYILRRNVGKKDIDGALAALKTMSWIVLHDPRQAIVLGKKVLGK